MVASSKLVPVLSLVLAAVLAGCTGDGGEPGTDSNGGSTAEPPKVEATATTGGIRGVVVDDRIVPIKGAFVAIDNVGKNMTTGEDGLFVFSGLEPGTYFLKVSQPLYAPTQVTAEVVAGDAEPKAVKVQLVRTVFAEPYLQTIKFDGFVVCSINVQFVGYSEECGEGVGTPAQTCDVVGGPCQPVPIVGGQRIGGQTNNNVQFDFTIGVGAKTLVTEQVWEATSAAGTAFYTPVATNWACDPFCGGNGLVTMDGPSPLRAAIDNATLDELAYVPDNTTFTMFTWASMESNPAGALLNQKFEDFVTVFYYLPAPEGWSFVNGDPNPFQ